VSDANACTAVSSITITGTPAAQITASPAFSSINEGDSVLLTAGGGIAYDWTPSIGLSCSTCADPIAAPAQTTTYSVTGFDANGCSNVATLTVEVKVDIRCNELFVPSIFSPNNAGPQPNDEVCVFSNCIAGMDFAIYDRWGQLVFQTKDPQQCWDGTKDGKELGTGVYTYRLFVKKVNGIEEKKSGSLTLTR
jgi:gliding motility-associated-like protein